MNTIIRSSKLILIFFILFVFTSCATLFTGTKDNITFRTDPPGATIYIDGVEQCITPCTLDVTRSLLETDVDIRLDGYEARYITLSKEFNVVSILNLGNLLGWAIDGLSGSIFKYDQKVYDLKLENKEISSFMYPEKIEIDNENNMVNIYVIEG